MRFIEKVAGLIGECAKDFILEEKESYVIVELTTKGEEITGRKAFVTDNAYEYFEKNKFEASGLKSYTKHGRVNTKFAYVIFESLRFYNCIHSISSDLDNIEKDVQTKAKG